MCSHLLGQQLALMESSDEWQLQLFLSISFIRLLCFSPFLVCFLRVCSEERCPLPTCWPGAVSPSRSPWLWPQTALWRGKQWTSLSSSRPTWETDAPRLTPSLWLWRSVDHLPSSNSINHARKMLFSLTPSCPTLASFCSDFTFPWCPWSEPDSSSSGVVTLGLLA